MHLPTVDLRCRRTLSEGLEFSLLSRGAPCGVFILRLSLRSRRLLLQSTNIHFKKSVKHIIKNKLHDHAAVYVEHLSSNIGRIIRQEECNGFRYIFRSSERS